jgi:DNA-binding beta-propeller fold protein YncE
MRKLAILIAGLFALWAGGCGGDDADSGTCAGPGCKGGSGGASGGSGGASGGTGGAGGAAAGSGGTAGSGGLGVGGSPPSPFTVGHVFVAGSRNARVFELDEQLQTVTSWTHSSFGQELPPPGQSLDLGPAGMAFDKDGNLVVAGLSELCVFSKPGVVLACHPKVKAEATENLIFDKLGNIYSTTATGGTNEIQKYDDKYNFVTTFSIPSGSLTGITCDPESNLYVASQNASDSQVYKVDKSTLTVLDTIPLPGLAEGLQFVGTSSFLVAAKDYGVREVASASPYTELTAIADPGLLWAVPVTTDNAGNVYTADYENGNGTAPADLYEFDANGNLIVARMASEIYGPFGMIVAGTKLPCGAYQPIR